jgi:sugar O-acyltransferase (sialic acid O-acetyltransferase NeuD family)
MKKLLILGAGGLGRETCQWALDIQKQNKVWDSIAFLDDDRQALDKYGRSGEIVGTIKDYKPQPGEEVVCAIGNALVKNEIFEALTARGAVFTSIIHPTVVLSDRFTIGKDVIVGPGSVISTDAVISDCCVVNTLAVVGHDVVLEKGCIVSDFCDLMGFSYLEELVFLGSGAKILPSVRIGRNARVGTGSVVIRKVKADTTVFGNPAKVIYSPKK